MKKLAFILMTAFFAVSCAFGQGPNTSRMKNSGVKKETKVERPALKKLEGNVVSSVSRHNFLSDFPEVSNVKWARVNTFDEATFTEDGNVRKAFYDYEGNLVGTTTQKTIKDLPLKAQQEISSKYKDYSVRNVLEFNDNEAISTDMLLYGIQFDDADNYFVELSKSNDAIVLRVGMNGAVYLFKKL